MIIVCCLAIFCIQCEFFFLPLLLLLKQRYIFDGIHCKLHRYYSFLRPKWICIIIVIIYDDCYGYSKQWRFHFTNCKCPQQKFRASECNRFARCVSFQCSILMKFIHSHFFHFGHQITPKLLQATATGMICVMSTQKENSNKGQRKRDAYFGKEHNIRR